MVSSSLRRSKRGKSDSFNEGDNVEIVKNKGVLSGVLIRKLDESRPLNPVWIVRFDNGMKDQAIPEKSFGRVVPTSKTRGRPRSNSDNSSSATNSSDVDDKAASTNTSVTSARLSSSKKGVKQKIPKKKSTKNKQKQQSQADVEGLSENMSHSKNDKNSVITEAEGEQHQQGAGINTRSSTKGGKRNYASLDTATLKPPPKKSKKDTKEEYVKVQYSRSTLFLYRGENPRAVFKWNY